MGQDAQAALAVGQAGVELHADPGQVVVAQAHGHVPGMVERPAVLAAELQLKAQGRAADALGAQAVETGRQAQAGGGGSDGLIDAGQGLGHGAVQHGVHGARELGGDQAVVADDDGGGGGHGVPS